ncbi:2-deoxystreptamine glucosyltransferase [Rosistilla ulvae]|uniref:2-deoxystreptamine glucosyltransferase n=1 Tax=Rosistilla ulvae TaxID=1930277 RepID=A0A517M0D6_9BACT|nr:glycosyltransferase family 4 protein [Rosistilla ulvae]QDS88340.1 2-deoxystreptamine glucosyltransferase [Rosistilla ulvae]
MNILFLTNNPNLGSTARALLTWAEEIQREGHEVRVVCPTGRLSQTLTAKGIATLNSSLPWFDRRRPWAAAGAQARVAVWGKNADIIHCNEHNVYPFGALLGRLIRKPVVCHVRFDIDRKLADWMFGSYGAPAALLWTSLNQQKRCAPIVKGVVPSDRQRVVRLGLDLRDFGRRASERELLRSQHDIGSETLVVGTASAFRPVKRLEDFVEIIRQLRCRYPHVVGMIAGGAVPGLEDYWKQINAMITSLNADAWILRTGHVDDIEPVLQSMDIFVSTSELETFGNSVCEAMACGKPVVGYEGGSVAEVVGDPRQVVANGDIDELTERLARMLEDRLALEEVGRRGRERVATKFNSVARVPELLSLYRTLLRQDCRGSNNSSCSDPEA